MDQIFMQLKEASQRNYMMVTRTIPHFEWHQRGLKPDITLVVLGVEGDKTEKKQQSMDKKFIKIEVKDDRSVILLNPLNGNQFVGSLKNYLKKDDIDFSEDLNDNKYNSELNEFLKNNYSFRIMFSDYLLLTRGTSISHTDKN